MTKSELNALGNPVTTYDATDGAKKTSHDSRIEAALAKHMADFEISPLEAVKHFPVLGRRQSLKRFLAHHELFQRTLNVPGDIAELGVFRGLGLMGWANFLEAYCIGDRTKTVWGFDNWRGFSSFSEADGRSDASVGKTEGGFSPSRFRQELESAIAIYDADRFVSWKPRIKLVDGEIEETASKFVADHPGVRFSLVHFDCDLYAPTKAALEAFWPRLSRGGIFIFDEYSIPDWPGETQAVDEFLADKPALRLQTFDWTNAPAAFLIKP
ncbi:MAG: TylF/MycF/NovP-related O-methyltransferase [Alphaproteobacteria bacterium]